MASHNLAVPISEDAIRALRIGDSVRLSGIIVTARDAAHKYLTETFIQGEAVSEEDRALHVELKALLGGGVIFHCGPVVRSYDCGRWEFVTAGPTTSIRDELYEPGVIAHFGIRGVIGKGGMGRETLRAFQDYGAAYFHAVGGAAALIASAVKEVLTVHKMEEFGIPEALWVIRVEGFPAIVTMDSHGNSIHDQVLAASTDALQRMIGSGGVSRPALRRPA